MKTINKHHTLSYISGMKYKISDKLDREEYLVTLDLYLDYKMIIQNMFKEKDPLVLDVYNFLKQRSQYNKSVIRSLASYRIDMPIINTLIRN